MMRSRLHLTPDRSWWRWTAVIALIAVLLGLPWVVARRPVAAQDVSAAQLLQRIQTSNAPYSGYAESTGGLGLPVTDRFSSLADLLGGRTQMRVWWSSVDVWRVDTVSATGEDDLYRDLDGYWEWNYEKLHATRTVVAVDPLVRLPRDGDLLPTELGRRLLSQATAAEVTRLSPARIAGVDAPGLRLRPADPATSIDHVDVWADPQTGLALRVEAFGKGDRTAVVTTQFLDFSRGRPTERDTTFVEPPTARTSTSSSLDLLANRSAIRSVHPPATLAGLALNRGPSAIDSSVGVYGRGVTELVAVPLRGQFAGQLRRQLESAATTEGNRLSLGAGPLNVLLVTADRGQSWLLTGTVTPTFLAAAADELAANPPENR